MTDERAILQARLRALATRLNSYYPRPAGSPMPFGEEAARAEAREVEARLRELREER
jgi:hypothetical protein